MTKASRKGLTILAVLRIDGPLTVEKIAKSIGATESHVKVMLVGMWGGNKAFEDDENRWDVTWYGKALFQDWCDATRGLASARARDAACRGMRV